MKKTLVLSLVAISMSINALAIDYDDGQEHDISTPINDTISIWDDGIAAPTTVNLISGGSVNHADIHDTSSLNVFTDSWVGSIGSHAESNFTIFGGSVDEAELYHGSHGTISGGIVSEIDVWNESHISVSGGDIVGTPVGPGSYTPGMTINDNGTAEILGGFINIIHSSGNSTVEMSGGQVEEFFAGGSQAEISGGQVTSFAVFAGDVQASMSGGEVDVLIADDSSTMELFAGTVNVVNSNRNASVLMTGGQANHLDAFGESTITVSGGHFYSLYTDFSGLIVIHGSGFNYDYGYIADSSGWLTGTLLSGETFDVPFDCQGGGAILLVPEPTTLLLVGIGAVMMRRRK